MSIYIKTTAKTADIFSYYDSRNIKYFQKAFTDIPAHGNLIDRDAILKDVEEAIDQNDKLQATLYKVFKEWIFLADVVIPADGGE